MVNSSQYKELIQTMKKFDTSKKDDIGKNLFTLAQKLDAYITHKAADGVKANTYKKLAAVQEANKWISDGLREFGMDTPSCYAEAYEQCKNKADLPEPGNMNYKDIAGKLSKLDPGIDARMAENADNCMCMIILKADSKKRSDLIDMRNKFNLIEAPKINKQGPAK